MKQHISVEQLVELSDKQKLKLYHVGQNKLEYEETKYVCDKGPLGKGTLVLQLPLLSIGQMIEIINDDKHMIELSYSLHEKQWRVYYGCEIYTSKEAVDALWQAFKSIL